MKNRYAFLASCSLVLAGAVYAIDLPGSLGGAAATRTTSSATARLPRASAAATSQMRARADIRASRLRAGANTDVQGSASLHRSGLRASGNTHTAAGLRIGGGQTADTRPDGDPSQSQDDNTARDDRQRPGTRIDHQARTYFINRFAQIEHLRDVAVESGNINLLKRADELEARLRDEMHRYSVELNARVTASQQIDANPNSVHAEGQAEGEAAARVSRQPRRRPQPAGSGVEDRDVQPNASTDAGQQTAGEANASQ